MDLLFLIIIGGLVSAFGFFLATRKTAPSNKKDTEEAHSAT